MRLRRIVLVLLAAGLLAPSTTLAWKPVGGDGRVGYWLAEMDFDGIPGDMDGYGIEAGIWLTPRLGIDFSYWPTNGGGLLNNLDTNYVALDLYWRFLSGERGYLAGGLGWQSTALTIPGERISTKGVRVVLEGQAVLAGPFSAYARYARLPDLDNLDPVVVNGDGREYGLGFLLDVRVFDIFAGYKDHDMRFDFTGPGAGEIRIDNDGIVAGIGWAF